MAGAFYDAGELFERYRSAVRPGPWSANFVMEEPALLDALGDECEPRPERLGGEDDELPRRARIPLFLLLAGERD